MDDAEKLRRERIHETSNMSQFELAKLKAERKRQQNNKYYTPVAERPVEKKEKPRGCFVTVMVTDTRGEYTHTWQAPQLMGTVIAAKQNKQGYVDELKPALEKAFGRLL